MKNNEWVFHASEEKVKNGNGMQYCSYTNRFYPDPVVKEAQLEVS